MVGKTPAPWNVNEKWEYWSDPVTGKRYAKVTGRQRCPDSLKKDYAWWFRNDYEQTVDEAPWYHPEWPKEKRELYWTYFRNPLQNARLFVWGWADRNYTVEVVEGNPDPMVVQRNDVLGPDGKPEQGYQKAKLVLDDGTETRTFVSYCSSKLVYYSGTQPSGIFGVKWNPIGLKFW